MPRTGDYSLGKIYKLVSNQTDDVYIGSTSQKLLSKRLVGHRRSYKEWLRLGDKSKNMTSYEILKYGDCQIILFEDFPCENKYQLEARERYYIENNKCVNKVIPTRSKKEYIEQNRDKISNTHKLYYRKHAEQIKNYQKVYNVENREKVTKRNKEYANKHKQEIEEYQKQYRIENKERLTQHKGEKITCEICGEQATRRHLRRHQRTIKCKNHLVNSDV